MTSAIERPPPASRPTFLELFTSSDVDADAAREVRRRTTWTILIVAAALRLLWLLLVDIHPVSDSYAYMQFARNILDHGVFGWTPTEPTIYWSVGTAGIIAGIQSVVGRDFVYLEVFNFLISMASVYFTMWVAERHFGWRVGVVAGMVMAFWPTGILYTTIIASEVMFIALVTFGLWLVDRPGGSSIIAWAVSGVVWAGAIYVRPVGLFVPLILAGSAVILAQTTWRRALVRLTVAYVIALALIAPWTWRNYQVFGKPVLVSANFGSMLWMGNNPATTGEYQQLPDDTKGLSLIERDRQLGDRAKAYILEKPLAFVGRTMVKAVRLHGRETIAVHWNKVGITESFGAEAWNPFKLLTTSFWYLMLGLSLVGLAFNFVTRPWRAALFNPPLLLWAYFTALHAIIVVADRYHLVSEPYIAVFAGFGVVCLLDRFRGRRDATATASE